MGIDVQLYAVGEVSDEEIAVAEAYLRDRCAFLAPDDGPLLSRFHERIELETLSRYWSSSYRRGSWPDIYAAIVAMRVAFPQCAVFYSGDNVPDGYEATDEELAELWAHWLDPTRKVCE